MTDSIDDDPFDPPDELPPSEYSDADLVELVGGATVIDIQSRRRQGGASTRAFDRGDHVELGERMLTVLRAQGEVVATEGDLYQYHKARGIFRVVPQDEQSRIVQDFAGCKRRTEKGTLTKMRVKRHDVVGSLALAYDQVCQSTFFAEAPTGVAFRDCFVALDGTKVIRRDHGPENRARYAFDHDYVADAVPERFLAFLHECFARCPDAPERITCLQQYAGVSLFGLATLFQLAIVLLGDGANGKGVFLKLLEDAMPTGACVAIPPQSWGQEYRTALLAGKRLNLVNELPEADIIDAESFKSVIAGDTMTGRHIRQSPFTFKPVAGHLFATNRLPGTADQTHGFWRRLAIVGFPNIVPLERKNPQLANELRSELPAIVAWMIEGAAQAVAAGSVVVPASSAEAISGWKLKADQVRAFLSEETHPIEKTADIPDHGTRADALYRAYSQWTKDTGHRALSSTKLGERLKQIGIEHKKSMTGLYYAVGLGTRPDNDGYDDDDGFPVTPNMRARRNGYYGKAVIPVMPVIGEGLNAPNPPSPEPSPFNGQPGTASAAGDTFNGWESPEGEDEVRL